MFNYIAKSYSSVMIVFVSVTTQSNISLKKRQQNMLTSKHSIKC